MQISGKDVVVLGRSNIVGMPVAHMLQSMDATVTVCHSRTADIRAHVRRADIVIAAVGKAEMVSACADTYVPRPPYGTHGPRVQPSASRPHRRRRAARPWAALLCVRCTRTSFGRAVRTVYRGTTGHSRLAQA